MRAALTGLLRCSDTNTGAPGSWPASTARSRTGPRRPPRPWCTREEVRKVSDEAQKIQDDIRHGRLLKDRHCYGRDEHRLLCLAMVPENHSHPHEHRLCLSVTQRHRTTGPDPATALLPVEADPRPLVTAALVAGLLAGYGIAIPVGAVATYLVALTARTSLKIGASAALGVATADGIYALAAVAGGTALTGVLQPVMAPLRWASVLVLVALAVRGSATAVDEYRKRRSVTGADHAPMNPRRAYLGLVGITIMNPTTVIYFTALVLGSDSAVNSALTDQAVFALAAFAASASWQLLLAGGGALLGRVLTGRRGRLVTALASSALITVLALRLLISAL